MVYVDYSNPLNPVVCLSRTHRRVAFGLALERFFREHGITGQENMVRVIKEGGYPHDIKQNTISNWSTGKSDPVKPSDLSKALMKALPATSEQMRYLSLACFVPVKYLRWYRPELIAEDDK